MTWPSPAGQHTPQVAYVLGIAWKLLQIHRGNYVAEEPVYLKYK